MAVRNYEQNLERRRGEISLTEKKDKFKNILFQVCHACLGRPPSTLQHSKLREDVSQDGDQLLSDISTIQKSYMEESLPVTEFTCDITEFFLPKDRKRRHSLMATQLEDSWSFASRLEEDCIIQMSTIPTLRSVTL